MTSQAKGLAIVNTMLHAFRGSMRFVIRHFRGEPSYKGWMARSGQVGYHVTGSFGQFEFGTKVSSGQKEDDF
ncbi:MAG: hypothetical protein HKN13_08035 [Rhodothermales bacterium]|nr:hypothetical protein [Rhodothermales bacterium]